MNDTDFNQKLMGQAIGELHKCEGYPKVGAVISKDDNILSSAYRGEIAGKHAERIAIEKLGSEIPKGCTIVTTLEPCVEMHCDQPEISCSELIKENNYERVIIGVLDPNGKIYSEGYKTLLEADTSVSFFSPGLRNEIEQSTFKFGDCSLGIGPSGTRRVAVVGSGKKFAIQLSPKEAEKIEFRWQSLQFGHSCVDLVGENDSIFCAKGTKDFSDITDPEVFREPSHYARMKEGNIAILSPKESSFHILIKLKQLTEFDITFQWKTLLK